MILRLLIIIVFISFTLLAVLPKGGGTNTEECKIRGCELGYAEGCVTLEESANVDENCKEEDCSICVTSPQDVCYKSHGICTKTESGCGWEQSRELNNCLKMVDAAEALKNRSDFTE